VQGYKTVDTCIINIALDGCINSEEAYLKIITVSFELQTCDYSKFKLSLENERIPSRVTPQNVQESGTTNQGYLLSQHQKRRILIQPQVSRQRL
jgi:hypothetical protein